MAKNKPQPQDGPELSEYITTAEPKAYADGVPVFCAHDAIVPIKDLRPNPKNPNQHPPEQIKLLASIIRATGWRAPITVSKRSGLVTKGHGRLMAAQLDDLTDAPVDYNEAAASYFVKNGEGWRDAWNFVDTALRLIENAEYLGDLRVIKEKGITFGPVTEQDAVPDFYPYWFAWAEFSVEETLTRNPKSYQHLL